VSTGFHVPTAKERLKQQVTTEKSWDQIVIGAGSSAINFLYYAFKGKDPDFLKYRTAVIGKTDLWTPMAPDHQMGQPGKLLRGVEEWKDTQTGWQKQQYLSSEGYVKSLDNLKDTVQLHRDTSGMKLQFINDTVSMVKPSSGRYEITTAENGRFYAQQVIVASGAGPGRKLNAPGSRAVPIENEHLLQSQPREYSELIDATDYLYTKPPQGLEVLIQGGSATASWAVAHAIHNQADFFWINGKGLQQIQTDGNPVARNTSTIRTAASEERICRGSISKIVVMDTPAPNPRLHVYFKAVSDNNLNAPLQKDEGLTDCVYAFHQVVHGLGGNPLGESGPGAILDSSIRENLNVLWDRTISPNSEDIAIAMVHRNDISSSLWIVGASLFRAAGREETLTKRIQDTYTSLNEMLTHASRPPEGIANLKIRLQALTGFAETDPAKFDWNLASAFQIEKLLSAVYGTGLSDGQRKELAGKIIAKRSTQTFVLPKTEIAKIVESYKKEKNLAIDPKKLQLDHASIDHRVQT